jgi:glycogen(starch) synthase
MAAPPATCDHAPMRALLLSWEYPPRIVGGLGRHVAALTAGLGRAGHGVEVVAREHPTAAASESHSPVHVTRVDASPPVVPFDDLLPWVMAFNTGVLAAGARAGRARPVDVVHVHDWLVASAGAELADLLDVPLVATVHATEWGRHRGHLPPGVSPTIHAVEGWLAERADALITCSAYMRDQVRDLFGRPEAAIDVIPNGVDVGWFTLDAAEVRAFRRTLADDSTHLVLFAGRLEYEKGVQTVLHALERVTDRAGPVRFLVAGVGTYNDELRALVERLGLGHRVRFTGFLEEHALRLHYAAADVAVAPSLYEPFGLVAAEAMACGTPVVASDTGGLREILAGGHGLTFPPEDAEGLADRIVEVLTDDALAADLVARGLRHIRARFDWDDVAARTADVYARSIADRAAAAAHGRARRDLPPVAAPGAGA